MVAHQEHPSGRPAGLQSGGLTSTGHLLHLAKSPAADLWELRVSRSPWDPDTALLCLGRSRNLKGSKGGRKWLPNAPRAQAPLAPKVLRSGALLPEVLGLQAARFSAW